MPRKYTPKEQVAAFWSKVDKSGGPDACWRWMGRCFPNGYGQIWIRGRIYTTHRHAFLLMGGIPTPEQPLVLHGERCPTNKGGAGRRCCNPAHLSSGNYAENNGRDRRRDGTLSIGENHGSRLHPESRSTGARNGAHTMPHRRPRGDRHGRSTMPSSTVRGERHYRAKLTDDSVLSILTALKTNETQSSIAVRFGVTQATISLISLRKIWSHIHPE